MFDPLRAIISHAERMRSRAEVRCALSETDANRPGHFSGHLGGWIPDGNNRQGALDLLACRSLFNSGSLVPALHDEYRTTFFSDAVEQRVLPGFIRRLRYVDIAQVKWKRAGNGHRQTKMMYSG